MPDMQGCAQTPDSVCRQQTNWCLQTTDIAIEHLQTFYRHTQTRGLNGRSQRPSAADSSAKRTNMADLYAGVNPVIDLSADSPGATLAWADFFDYRKDAAGTVMGNINRGQKGLCCLAIMTS